ncbi:MULTISPECIES: hypothetical protein [unclassified Paenibacillus]|uniref:hypothetical protein n=1 Tax=unclassified Paenibacillus TaxID=185978 RepID=UPI00362D8FC8
METYFIYDNKIPIEEKKMIVSTKKLQQPLLEKMAMDVRINKAKQQEKASGG